MRQAIEDYCVRELLRMHDGHTRTIEALRSALPRVTQPLLRESLREQIEANAWLRDQLAVALEILGHDVQGLRNAEVAAILDELGRPEADAGVQDMRIAHAAARLEHYAIGAYAALGGWLRQLGQHQVGTILERMGERLQVAQRHLDALQPMLTDLFHDPPHTWRPRHSPRLGEREVRSDLDPWNGDE